jgi:hypothetical protein
MTNTNKKGTEDFFTYLNAIFYKRKLTYNKKLCSTYLLSMWLSHDPELINLVNKLNPLQFLLRHDIIYQYYFEKVPKGRRFIRWTKKEKESKKRRKEIEELAKELNVSKIEASQILLVMERVNAN